MISESSPKSTCSPGSEAGPSPSGSRDGAITAPSGPDPAPVNPSPLPESRRGKRTVGTSGLRCSVWSERDALSASLGSRLQTLLDTGGSMEYRQTWREKVTKSGRRYLAHTASALRTSDNGFGGWRSPNGSDGEGGTYDILKASRMGAHPKLKLRDQALLAGWATPNVPRAHDSDETAFAHYPNKKQTDMVHQILGRGTTSSPAPTGKRGALNPALPRWLMGFPPEWDACAVMVMPSSRKSRQPSSKPT